MATTREEDSTDFIGKTLRASVPRNSERRRLFDFNTYEDVAGVGDGGNDSCGNHELLPGLGEVDDVNSFSVALVHVGVHQV